MVTFTAFTPSPQAAFQFQPILDRQPYTAIVPFSLFGQRYYLDLYTLSGVRVFSRPLVESPVGVNLQTLAWNTNRGVVMATAIQPHGYALGKTIALTISGCMPETYNGAVKALITGAQTFTYPLDADPGVATVMGAASYQISMTAGYFDSTLVLRNGQFEVSP